MRIQNTSLIGLFLQEMGRLWRCLTIKNQWGVLTVENWIDFRGLFVPIIFQVFRSINSVQSWFYQGIDLLHEIDQVLFS